MEKKGAGRQSQGSAKGLAADSKKSQDVTGGKLWPRNGRRREPSSGGGAPPKSESSSTWRKPVPQRTKTLDKRPRPRGPYVPAAVAAGKESAQVDEVEEPELGSVFVQGSKKQSLNHLLNFHYAPRDQAQGGRPTNAGNHGGGGRWMSTGKHKYNKEHFIQANCQFIVNSSGDYRQYMNNPDALVDWSLIEQVNVQVHELPSCPICLYPPSAAKMTRCGHIYCWSCVLHYLALAEKPWRKCPICYEAIHTRDLKSVVPIPHGNFNVNETITFKLMKRARGSLIAYPVDEFINDESIFHMSDRQAANVYCKLLLANKSDILSIIEREKRELQHQLQDGENEAEYCFIENSLALLKERENLIFAKLDDAVALSRERYDSVCSDDVAVPAKQFYFYQAADGQHIYLHALNAKMLEHTYGSLEHCPKTLMGRIVEKEGGSMTEELRKRLRYLQHLPVTCQFEVAEIHLHPPAVSKDTAKYFEEQIEIRRRRRQKRAREEKRREKKIAEEENRAMGKYPVAEIELENHNQFPEFNEAAAINRERSISSRSSSPVSEISSGPSFATMLATKKEKSPICWPGLSPSVGSSAKLINVTGQKTQVTPRASKQDDSEPDCEDYVPAPEYNRSFSDAIAMALEKAAKITMDGNEGESKSGKAKKKKNKQKILFATSMTYGGN